MKVYEAVVKGLEGIGVTAAFGGAGENAAGLMIALKHSERIRPVIVRHEQAASFMACGYAMYTDRLGVCFATAGPGAFNLFSGLAVAMSDSYPVLAISGYASLDWEGRGSLNETSGLNNTPDSRAMFEATTKGSFLIRDIAGTCDVLEQAVNLAFEGRPGPVHIHVPENLTEPGLAVPDYRDIRLTAAPVRPDPDRVEEIASVLAGAIARGEPIVALVGSGAIRSGAGGAVRHFIERFQIPLVTTLDGKGIVPEAHPLCAGVFGDSGHASARKVFRQARVVLGIGNALNQHATFNYHEGLCDGKVKVAHPGRTVVVEFQNPDFAACARACGADGYRVDPPGAFEDAFRAALASGRPSVIDARITRWAVPHYSPSPDGLAAGLIEDIEARFRAALSPHGPGLHRPGLHRAAPPAQRSP
jgi:acetolactate synthase I/II/III large subunit